ncbi:ParB/RepB/Spo0J family partition protein [Xylocopilactobacillus apicola]|uniref:Nucleoid occlusion protein n=1 Tax=Xylocopilactobacillus apicola TaxID=2932184 RepID=A0AAU9DSH8_9LACO|nr:ParB/RepB/Spo0J family partition protein [Xylocopilactobacillus apicola]BDR58999.1 nucleoid occlusion protein [Xylocopilactobacillus apicola]
MPNNFFNFFKPEEENNREDEGRLMKINVEDITANRHQPRKIFQEDKIKELAQSIEKNGLLQPIVVREYEPEKYEIIAGERRFRAVQSLKWPAIEAIVREFDNTASAIQALNENLQRENLSVIEEAQAYQELLKMTKGTQESLARQLGKSQSSIANKLRLLKLDQEVQQSIAEGKISERHGRELLRLSETDQKSVLKEVIENNFNVKQTKDLIDQRLNKVEKPTKKAKNKPRANILNKMDSLLLATQTVKQSLDVIEKNGIIVSQKVKQVSKDQVEMVIELKKNNGDPLNLDAKKNNGGN